MTCPSCTLRVERAIHRAPGVISTSASLALGWAVVDLDVSGSGTSENEVIAEIIGQVRRVGYRASLRRQATEPDESVVQRYLLLRFGLAAAVLAVLAAMGQGHASPAVMGVLGMVVLLGSGLPVLADGIKRWRYLSLNHNGLTTLGAVGAYVLGARDVLRDGQHHDCAVFFEASTALIAFALLSQLLQRRTFGQMRSQVQRVLKRAPELLPLVLEAQVTKGQRQIAMDALVRMGLPITAAVAVLLVLIRAQLGLDLVSVVVPSLSIIAAAAPYGPGVSVTLAAIAALQRGAERNVLFRDVENMEMLAEITALVATKSVVSQGTPRVQKAVIFHPDERELLALVAGSEAGSIQPAGRALCDYAIYRGVRPMEVDRVEVVPGYGLRAWWGAREVLIGSRALMDRTSVEMSRADAAVSEIASSGCALAFAAIEGNLAGVFALADRARPGINPIIATLRRQGISTTLLTGDPAPAASALAREAGIEQVLAAIPPDRRADELNVSRDADGVLAVSGDPNRDGDLLAAGDVSIAVSEILPAGEPQPGLWLLRGTFADLIPAIEVARHGRRVAMQNAFIGVGWTMILLVAAALGILGPHGPFIAGGGSALLSSVLALSTRRLFGRQPPVR